MRNILLLAILLIIPNTLYAKKVVVQIPGGEVFFVEQKKLRIDFASALKIANKAEENINKNIWFMQSIHLISHDDFLVWEIKWQRYGLREGQSNLKQILINMDGKYEEMRDIKVVYRRGGGRAIFVEKGKLKIDLFSALKIAEKFEKKHIDKDIWFLQSIDLIPYSDYFVWQIQWQRYVPKKGQDNFKQILRDMDGKWRLQI